MTALVKLITLLPLLALARAATKDEWRSRSIYQLITDRFAPPSDNTPCALGDRSYCGGTWQTVISKLDYIQGMGFDAIWISPTALNLEGFTEYGEAYHGYWTADPTKLNPHFGTDSDLKALSSALHSRGMYLMVDIAINGLASTSYSLDAATLASDDNGSLLFKDPADYHPRCGIDWGNHTSEQICWMATGDDNNGVALMDLKQESDAVSSVLYDWVGGYVSDYAIDGFRIDASKHMPKSFQHEFCQKAGTFCIGEVAGDDTQYAASYQGDSGIDSVWGFGMLYGLAAVFSGGKTMSTLSYYISQAAQYYPDPTVIGNFLDNQDQPRFNSRTSDKFLVYNAIVGNFMYGGIPTVYYGLEQDIADGSADPDNREALWLYGNYGTDGETYKRITTLNKIRGTLGSNSKFHNVVATVLASQNNDIALKREEALIVLTNRGASGTGTWTIKGTQLGDSAAVVDLLSCTNGTTDASGALTVTWTTGQPFVWVTADVAASGGFCGATASNTTTSATSSPSTSASVSAASVPATANATASPGDLIVSANATSAAATSSANATASAVSSTVSAVNSTAVAETGSASAVAPLGSSSVAGSASSLPATSGSAQATGTDAATATGPESDVVLPTSTSGSDATSFSPTLSNAGTGISPAKSTSTKACKRSKRRAFRAQFL
ncbi:hypothetical protein IAR55_006438 [Kwoniella newhampshirensis]|uniref:alpha-amylase n=1 Tax=Kwoniella newhampshirensis TaxID=1651941 RepID=A0AAW0YTX3_9TREE